jgi:hypothetical protein
MSIIVVPPNPQQATPPVQFTGVTQGPTRTVTTQQAADIWNASIVPARDPFEGVDHTEYRVRLRRTAYGHQRFSVTEEAIVIVEAGNEEDAERIAMRMENDEGLDWEELDDRDWGDSDIDNTDRPEVEDVEEN